MSTIIKVILPLPLCVSSPEIIIQNKPGIRLQFKGYSTYSNSKSFEAQSSLLLFSHLWIPQMTFINYTTHSNLHEGRNKILNSIQEIFTNYTS